MKPPCMALVTWLDAMMQGHWNEGAPNPKSDLLVFSAGFLIYEDKERIVLVQSLTDGSYGNELQIPRGMVKEIARVKYSKRIYLLYELTTPQRDL